MTSPIEHHKEKELDLEAQGSTFASPFSDVTKLGSPTPSRALNNAGEKSPKPTLSSHSTLVVDEEASSPHVPDAKNSTGKAPHPVGYRLKPGLDPAFEVRFDENDPMNPKTWNRAYRWYINAIAAILVLNATFASTIPTGIAKSLEAFFKISEEVETLIVSLFLFGYCIGPLLWGPLSEKYGRKPVFLVSFTGEVCFQVGCALSRNTGSMLVFRFITGCFAAAPLANAGAVISDIWDVETRGKALALYTLAPFAGPTLGPTVSGFMEVSGVDWRWSFWLLTLFAGVCLAVIAFTIPETYAPKILRDKAKKLRKETGDDRWWAPTDSHAMETPTVREVLHQTIEKPFIMIFSEPMLAAIVIYMSFIYGCLYLEFEAYPIVFVQMHGIENPGLLGLTFLPIFIGGITAVIAILVFFNPQYRKFMKQYAPKSVPPERRLYMAMIGGPIFSLSFFWFGWTSFRSVSYWAPLFAGLPFGLSVILIFQSMFNYLIDTYLQNAASALSINTVCRSVFGAAFPLFATQMFNAMTPKWASTLLGLFALAMVPIPFIFVKYGPQLRKRSTFSPHDD